MSLYQYLLYKYPTVASLAQLHEQLKYEGPHNVAAIIVESITGTNGIVRPPKGYLEACAHVICCVHLYTINQFCTVSLCDRIGSFV